MRPQGSWAAGAGLAVAVLALTVLAQQMDVLPDRDVSSEASSVVVAPHEPAFSAPTR